MLPFSRSHIDYCALAYVIPESRAANMAAVLELLSGVSEAQAEAKREQCRRAAPALTYSARDPHGGSGAVTHILSELCGHAAGKQAPPPSRSPAFDERCLLLPPREAIPSRGDLWGLRHLGESRHQRKVVPRG